jgi:type IV conjugative transfer system coupling protein TraD
MINLTKSLAEGGQTWAHRMRMLRQVIKIVICISAFILILSIILFMLWNNTPLLIALYYNMKASIVSIFDDKLLIDPQLWKNMTGIDYGNREFSLSVSRVMKATDPKLAKLYPELLKGVYLGLKTFCASTVIIICYFLIRGCSSKGKTHVSGSKVAKSWFLRLKLQILRKASNIKIGQLPYVKDTETMHTLITGGTGSGKTNCLHHILTSIREAGSKTIVIDTTGAFVSRYYRQGKDVILNPFDERGVGWSPWAECENKFDYEELAESFIPISNNESERYWRMAAKSLFSSLLQKLDGTKKVSDLVRWALFASLRDLSGFIEGTKAASHLDINSEKTAGSVRSVASSFLECLEHIEDIENPFSIKKWVSEEDDSWLFICCKPSQRASIAPLISSWISIAVRGVLSLDPSRTRRIWFVLDELPTLNKVKGLETLLTEGRKYGACALLALQSPSQLESIYGRDVSHIIAGNCSTKIVFSEYDPEIAERISKIFGVSEIGEYQEGISYGAHEMRDGVNLSYQKKKQATVSATDIQSLKPNQAYIRLSGKQPITKMRLKIHQ